MADALIPSGRCGIILAAGDGTRLRSLVLRLKGYPLPKQYVNFIGTRSMLEHTYLRVEKIIPPERLFTVVGRDHLDFPEAQRQLRSRPKETVIVQPENKETGPGLFLPLMHLHNRHPDATVAVFPSDHFIAEEDLFMEHVESACRLVERDPSRIVLLGVEPDDSEAEYGYILPAKNPHPKSAKPIYKISRFIEKPSPAVAGELIAKGGIWNTMVMTFKAKRLIDLVRRVAPDFHRVFHRIGKAIGSDQEASIISGIYRKMESVNFSKDFLEIFSLQKRSPLLVLPVRGVLWSDWGSEHRIVNMLNRISHSDPILRSTKKIENAC